VIGLVVGEEIDEATHFSVGAPGPWMKVHQTSVETDSIAAFRRSHDSFHASIALQAWDTWGLVELAPRPRETARVRQSSQP